MVKRLVLTRLSCLRLLPDKLKRLQRPLLPLQCLAVQYQLKALNQLKLNQHQLKVNNLLEYK